MAGRHPADLLMDHKRARTVIGRSSVIGATFQVLDAIYERLLFERTAAAAAAPGSRKFITFSIEVCYLFAASQGDNNTVQSGSHSNKLAEGIGCTGRRMYRPVESSPRSLHWNCAYQTVVSSNTAIDRQTRGGLTDDRPVTDDVSAATQATTDLQTDNVRHADTQTPTRPFHIYTRW